jgi:type IV secretion system protein VirB5
MSNNVNRKTPVSATIQGKGLFERWGGAVVESNRWFIGFILMSVVCLVQLFSIIEMMPLKTVVPWMVTVKDTGRVEGSPVESIKFTPDENAKRYFLKEWVTKIFTLDKFLTEKYLIDAYNLVRGQGAEEFRRFIEETAPMVALRSEPTLVQNITIRSVSFIQDSAALIRIRIEKRTGAGIVFTDKLVTVHFSVIPPKTEAEIYANPIGLYITHFAISEDVN